MIRGLYTAVSGLITLGNRQNTITNNMTNANTTGFKSDTYTIKIINNYDRRKPE